jgi:hypothetical protein
MAIRIKKELLNTLFLVIIFSIILSIAFTAVNAAPVGPTVTFLGNGTKNTTAAAIVNGSFEGNTSGGYIFTLDLVSSQQNTRWKAYVGNVTGTLVLDDASDNRIFAWTLSTVTGEVYATRSSGNINWSGINCTWIADARDNETDDMINRSVSNRTPEYNENVALSHTNKEDNITATFALRNHSSITIGSVVIGKDECYSVHTYIESSAQSYTDSDTGNFTELILYDGAYNSSNGNVVYATPMEDDKTGYRSDSTYDFQMIVPEDGSVGFSSSTAYYFYVELS